MTQPDRHAPALARLADQLVAATELASVFDAFERIYLHDRAFMAACEFVQSAVLDQVLERVARRVGVSPTSWRWMTPLMRYAPSGFFHGSAIVGNAMAIVMYFEQRDVGLVVLTGRSTHYARFTLVGLRGAAVSSAGGSC